MIKFGGRTFGTALFRHEIKPVCLEYIAERRCFEKRHADMCRACAANAMDEMHASYLKGCNEALSRIEGIDFALSCLGYEWDDKAGRYSEIP